MTNPVNRRPYASPVRQARATATRLRILDSAAELFLANGYAHTSTAAIGRAAGVSEASVFAAWKSKADLLVAVIAHRVGADAQFPLRTQSGLTSGDLDRAVAQFAHIVRGAHERSWRLLAVAAAAAHDDPTVAEAVAGGAQRRHDDCAWFVREIAGVRGRGAARRIDAVWTLIGVDNYRRLVVERRWPAREYESWLAAMLRATLG